MTDRSIDPGWRHRGARRGRPAACGWQQGRREEHRSLLVQRHIGPTMPDEVGEATVAEPTPGPTAAPGIGTGNGTTTGTRAGTAGREVASRAKRGRTDRH